MKTYTIKNYNGQKTLIVNDLEKTNVQDLYILAVRMSTPFAVKKEIGIQIWGLSVVAKYLGINDSNQVLK